LPINGASFQLLLTACHPDDEPTLANFLDIPRLRPIQSSLRAVFLVKTRKNRRVRFDDSISSDFSVPRSTSEFSTVTSFQSSNRLHGKHSSFSSALFDTFFCDKGYLFSLLFDFGNDDKNAVLSNKVNLKNSTVLLSSITLAPIFLQTSGDVFFELQNKDIEFSSYSKPDDTTLGRSVSFFDFFNFMGLWTPRPSK
jgi:hypothetical protein